MTSDELFRGAVERFWREAGRGPDRNWVAFLRLATAARGRLWEKLERAIDWQRSEIDFEQADQAMAGSSSGERLLYQTAKMLFLSQGEVPVLELLAVLDADNWHILLDAFEYYREVSDRWKELPNLEEDVSL